VLIPLLGVGRTSRRTGDAGFFIWMGEIIIGCDCIVGDWGTDMVEMAESRGESDCMVIGISNPNPTFDFLACDEDSGKLPALARSAAATFSAVNSGTAGMGLDCADLLPIVIIFGCARTATTGGAAVMIAVERYAFVAIEARVAIDARVYDVATESRLVYEVSRLLYVYMLSVSLYCVSL
jgi:hypothetical protein